MHDIIDSLAELGVVPGICVHVGAAGAGSLDSWRRLSPRRLVLVNGDPTAAAELGDAAAGDERVQVFSRAVAPQDGPLTWHRFTVPGLDGPLDVSALSRYFPRLKRLGNEPMQAVALSSVLAGVGAERESGVDGVLVLDVPGQEGALVASLARDALAPFDVVVLRGCRHAASFGGTPPGETVERLWKLGFRTVSGPGDVPLWPVYVMRRDEVASELVTARDEIVGLVAARGAAEKLAAARLSENQQLSAAKATAEKSVQELRAQIDMLTQARTAADKLAADRLSENQRLTAAMAAAERTAQELQARIDALTQAKAALEKLAADRLTQNQQLNVAKAAAEKAAQDRQTQIDVLTQGKAAAEKLAAEWQAQVQQLTESRAAAERLAADRLAQNQLLTAANAAAEKSMQEQQAKIDALTQGKAAAETLAAERQAQVQQLTQGKAAADKLASDRLAQNEQLATARALAEKNTQERQATIEALTQARSAAEKLAEDRLGQIQQLTSAKSAAEKTCQDMAPQIETLTLAKVAAERLAADRLAQIDALAQARAEAEELAQERKAHVESLAHARAAADELAAQRQAQLQELAAARAAAAQMAQDEAQRGEAQRTALETRLADTLKRAQRAEEELRDTRRSLGVAVRTQALREGDLRDLQERYSRLLTEHQDTRELLSKLAQRLTVAQDYFRRLALPSGAEGGEAVHAVAVGQVAGAALAAQPAPAPAPRKAPVRRTRAPAPGATAAEPARPASRKRTKS